MEGKLDANYINSFNDRLLSSLENDQKTKISTSLFDGILKEHNQQMQQIDDAFSDMKNKIEFDRIIDSLSDEVYIIRNKVELIGRLTTAESYFVALMVFVRELGIECKVNIEDINNAAMNIRVILSDIKEDTSLNGLKLYRNPKTTQAELDEYRASMREKEELRNDKINSVRSKMIHFNSLIASIMGSYQRWRQEQTKTFTLKLQQQVNQLFGA
jgi:hypothetical protein